LDQEAVFVARVNQLAMEMTDDLKKPSSKGGVLGVVPLNDL